MHPRQKTPWQTIAAGGITLWSAVNLLGEIVYFLNSLFASECFC